MASYYIGVASWFCCALFAFWLSARVDNGREQIGRTLVGIGALIMGLCLVLPKSGPGALPPLVLLTVTAIGGIALLAGLILAYPRGGLRSVVDETGALDD